MVHLPPGKTPALRKVFCIGNWGEGIRLLLIVGATSQPQTPLGRPQGETGQVQGAAVGAQVLQVCAWVARPNPRPPGRTWEGARRSGPREWAREPEGAGAAGG